MVIWKWKHWKTNYKRGILVYYNTTEFLRKYRHIWYLIFTHKWNCIYRFIESCTCKLRCLFVFRKMVNIFATLPSSCRDESDWPFSKSCSQSNDISSDQSPHIQVLGTRNDCFFPRCSVKSSLQLFETFVVKCLITTFNLTKS